MPLLIHSSDLVKLAARWLELTGIIRTEVRNSAGKNLNASKVAYAIAAAEYRVAHKAQKFSIVPADRKADRPVLDYQVPIESAKGTGTKVMTTWGPS